jgi:hypothetical protein
VRNRRAGQTMCVSFSKTLTRPFTVRMDEGLMPDGSDLIEFIRHENQQLQKR